MYKGIHISMSGIRYHKYVWGSITQFIKVIGR